MPNARIIIPENHPSQPKEPHPLDSGGALIGSDRLEY
jgi:hypothetical protein